MNGWMNEGKARPWMSRGGGQLERDALNLPVFPRSRPAGIQHPQEPVLGTGHLAFHAIGDTGEDSGWLPLCPPA